MVFLVGDVSVRELWPFPGGFIRVSLWYIVQLLQTGSVPEGGEGGRYQHTTLCRTLVKSVCTFQYTQSVHAFHASSMAREVPHTLYAECAFSTGLCLLLLPTGFYCLLLVP